MITEKLNDVFKPTEGGIFHYLQDLNVPWDEEEIDGLLDYEYHYNIAGQRYISPLVHAMLDDDTGILDSTDKETLAGIIYAMYGLRWSKLWYTLGLEYNPIENYSMQEDMTNDITEDVYGKTETLTHGHTETETLNKTDTVTHGTTETLTLNTTNQETKNLTDAITPYTSETSTTEVQGFDSSTYNPSERTTLAKSGTESTTHTGTDTTTRTGTETTGKAGTEATAYTGTDTKAHSGQDTNTSSGKDTHERNYTLTRKGNIGVTTSQQMIESERQVWMWDFFKDVVFPDINRVLTLSIY